MKIETFLFKTSKFLFIFLIGIALFSTLLTVVKKQVNAASILVTTTDDELNSDSDCSLREAIISANLNTAVDACLAGEAGLDTITLPAGTITISIAGRDEEDAATGDFDIVIPESVNIIGAGTGLTIIDGNGLDRIFDIKSNIDDGVNPPAGPITEVTISDLTIQNGNPGANSGGGIMNRGYLTLDNVVVRNNTIEDFYWGGGGINSDGYSTLTLNNTTVDGNTGHVGGGIYLYDFSVFTSTNSTISNNTSPDDGDLEPYGPGGGIITFDTVTLNILNTTISGNTAQDGGGMHLGPSAAGTIINTTITNNTSVSGFGAGFFGDWQESVPTLTIKNTILSANNGQNCYSNENISNGYNLYDNNLISDPNSCIFNSTGDINTSDLFVGPLQDNGGSTFTHALELTSPAIDTADNVDCPSTDQRDSIRPFDADGDLNAVCDIGAYEYIIAATPTPTPTPTVTPSTTPTTSPTSTPSITPTLEPTISPTVTVEPTITPTTEPSPSITLSPTPTPTSNTGFVTGHIFSDPNGNGIQDSGEPSLPNVTVVITDGNGNTHTVVTDANGDFSATVASGQITVDVDETDPDIPSGTNLNIDRITITLAAGTTQNILIPVTGETVLAETGTSIIFTIVLGFILSGVALSVRRYKKSISLLDLKKS